MLYNNGFPQGYSYYQNQAPPMQLVQAQMPSAQNNTVDNGIVWVQGEAGAKAYPVPANGSAMLMDSEQQVFYIKTVDMSGMPNALRIFDYTERGNQPKTQSPLENVETNDSSKYEELEKQITDLNNKIKELEEQLLEVVTTPSSSNNVKKGGK